MSKKRRRLIIEVDASYGFDYEKPYDLVDNTVTVTLPRGVVTSVNVDTTQGIEEITISASHGVAVATVADPGIPPPSPIP